jgi:holo-[acyl-carrier protein] synthase
MWGPDLRDRAPEGYSVGIDLEPAARFEGAAADPLVRALFTPDELAWCARQRTPGARLAGTWCAKEAVVKALWPWLRLDPRRVRVTRSDDGGTAVAVPGCEEALEDLRVAVSISDRGSLASAVAVVSQIGLRPPVVAGEGAP